MNKVNKDMVYWVVIRSVTRAKGIEKSKENLCEKTQLSKPKRGEEMTYINVNRNHLSDRGQREFACSHAEACLTC